MNHDTKSQLTPNEQWHYKHSMGTAAQGVIARLCQDIATLKAKSEDDPPDAPPWYTAEEASAWQCGYMAAKDN